MVFRVRVQRHQTFVEKDFATLVTALKWGSRYLYKGWHICRFKSMRTEFRPRRKEWVKLAS